MTKYKLPKIQDMLDAGVHFGHQAKRWNPKMEKYIYTVSKNVHIIDLEKTEVALKEACGFLYEQSSLGKSIVFVGTKRQSKDVVELEAKRCGAMYVNERWVGGTITNFETIKKNLDKLLDLIKGREEGRFDVYTKRERLMIDRNIEKLQTSYGGIVSLKKSPEVLFVIDPRREKTAVKEARRAGVPVVGIVDTNADPTEVNYSIPANDDAIKSVALLVKAISSAVEEGYKEWGKAKKEKEEELRKEKEKELEVKSEVKPEEAIAVEEKLVEEVVREEQEKIVKESPTEEVLEEDSKKSKEESKSKKSSK
ncbi:30S ribosomal protein S2 [candidate division WWE3 bacterium]|uniref:Small ribosomal subunit protein uS2 n=1 Tax=candidate division WWE3 bacterium TaxID=2053526 RepID=A0A7X9E7V9_UNCKA|nr:30S ribosomal protein S2 [candidate division WWE3 bacterium]